MFYLLAQFRLKFILQGDGKEMQRRKDVGASPEGRVYHAAIFHDAARTEGQRGIGAKEFFGDNKCDISVASYVILITFN